MLQPSLQELTAVAAVAEHGGFRPAAKALGMSPSALSHAVATLEQRLGVRLFNRTTRSVALSEAGAEFLARVSPALREIASAVEAVNQHRDTPAGTLRINASESAARRIFAPIVLEYLRRCPDMRVELTNEGRLVDVVAQGFDLGVRLAEAVPQDMIAVPCGPDQRFAVVGSPRYFEDQAQPRTPADLATHRCIRRRLPSGAPFHWEFAKHGQELTVAVEGALTLEDPQLMIEAALAGAGLAYVTEHDIAGHVAAGRLKRALEDWTPPFPGLCVYYPRHRHGSAGLRAFIRLVRELAPSL